jgi:hypothetical protein
MSTAAHLPCPPAGIRPALRTTPPLLRRLVRLFAPLALLR